MAISSACDEFTRRVFAPSSAVAPHQSFDEVRALLPFHFLRSSFKIGENPRFRTGVGWAGVLSGLVLFMQSQEQQMRVEQLDLTPRDLRVVPNTSLPYLYDREGNLKTSHQLATEAFIKSMLAALAAVSAPAAALASSAAAAKVASTAVDAAKKKALRADDSSFPALVEKFFQAPDSKTAAAVFAAAPMEQAARLAKLLKKMLRHTKLSPTLAFRFAIDFTFFEVVLEPRLDMEEEVQRKNQRELAKTIAQIPDEVWQQVRLGPHPHLAAVLSSARRMAAASLTSLFAFLQPLARPVRK